MEVGMEVWKSQKSMGVVLAGLQVCRLGTTTEHHKTTASATSVHEVHVPLARIRSQKPYAPSAMRSLTRECPLKQYTTPILGAKAL